MKQNIDLNQLNELSEKGKERLRNRDSLQPYYNRTDLLYKGSHKTCVKCGVLKSKEGFYSNKANKDKILGTCKECCFWSGWYDSNCGAS